MMREVSTEKVIELGDSIAEVMTLTLSVTLVGISSTISVEEGISMSAVEAKIDSLAMPISVVLNVTLVGFIERLRSSFVVVGINIEAVDIASPETKVEEPNPESERSVEAVKAPVGLMSDVSGVLGSSTSCVALPSASKDEVTAGNRESTVAVAGSTEKLAELVTSESEPEVNWSGSSGMATDVGWSTAVIVVGRLSLTSTVESGIVSAKVVSSMSEATPRLIDILAVEAGVMADINSVAAVTIEGARVSSTELVVGSLGMSNETLGVWNASDAWGRDVAGARSDVVRLDASSKLTKEAVEMGDSAASDVVGAKSETDSNAVLGTELGSSVLSGMKSTAEVVVSSSLLEIVMLGKSRDDVLITIGSLEDTSNVTEVAAISVLTELAKVVGS